MGEATPFSPRRCPRSPLTRRRPLHARGASSSHSTPRRPAAAARSKAIRGLARAGHTDQDAPNTLHAPPPRPPASAGGRGRSRRRRLPQHAAAAAAAARSQVWQGNAQSGQAAQDGVRLRLKGFPVRGSREDRLRKLGGRFQTGNFKQGRRGEVHCRDAHVAYGPRWRGPSQTRISLGGNERVQ